MRDSEIELMIIKDTLKKVQNDIDSIEEKFRALEELLKRRIVSQIHEQQELSSITDKIALPKKVAKCNFV